MSFKTVLAASRSLQKTRLCTKPVYLSTNKTVIVIYFNKIMQ